MSEILSNEFLLQDRLQKIRQIINKYGEENFYLSYSVSFSHFAVADSYPILSINIL